MYHAILAFLAGLLHPAAPAYCHYQPMLAYGDNARHPSMIASATSNAPCASVADGRLARLPASLSKGGRVV
jgi:hypothetical protein